MLPLTICIIAYGDYPDLLARCVESIFKHTPTDRFRLIVCLNEPGDESIAYAHKMACAADTLMISRTNICVEGALTLALHACRTPAMVRLDDDSWVLRKGWLEMLSKEVDALPKGWGVLGRFKRGGVSMLPPGQGYISIPWARAQPWYNGSKDSLLSPPSWAVSGGFCVMNVANCIAAGVPPDSYAFFEEDHLTSIMLQHAGHSIHESDLITRQSTGADVKIPCSNPYIAIGDAPSRTDRTKPRPRWKT